MIFPFLATFILIAILFNISSRRVSRKTEEREASFWQKELEANNVRKKSLDSLEYIHIPLDLLPFNTAEDDEYLQGCENEVLALKDEKIVNLTGISNTDLKLEYGTANITVLSQYDQNYTALVCALQKWGQALYDRGRYEDAAKVLEFAARTRSDITATYRVLADLYRTKLGYNEDEIKKKIDGLIPIAKNLNALSKSTILKILEPEPQEEPQ
ncbi:MAG: hypothetical protein E7307_11520 [Butyrivibrio sp.]|nr:hypothetical protein [Butyrivibrio sp.]